MTFKEQFPYLQDGNGGSWLDSVEKGWRPIFGAFCVRLNTALLNNAIPLNKFVLLDVKEKLGALRVYWGFADDYISEVAIPEAAMEDICELVDFLERESEGCCHACGEMATRISVGYVLPFCEECAKKAYAAFPIAPDFDKAFIEID